MEIGATVTINAPIKKVWDIFTGLTCWMNWNTIVRDVYSNEKIITNGSDIKCTFRPFFFPIKVEIKVEEVRPYERIVWSAQKRGLSARHEFLFKSYESKVVVRSKETFTGLLTKGSGFLLPKRRMKNLAAAFLKDLKRAAENEKA
ncbi:MAG: SRPBCC family protein [Nitrospirota bacterium]